MTEIKKFSFFFSFYLIPKIYIEFTYSSVIAIDDIITIRITEIFFTGDRPLLR